MRRIVFLFILLASPAIAKAQNRSLDGAAATITESDVARRIRIIADDSMMGRDTPSRGLELTAQYVADEFKRFGLTPGGENGTWFQRYNVMRARLNPAASHVGFMAAGSHLHAELSRDARYLYGGIPAGEVGGPAIIFSGTWDTTTTLGEQVKDRVALVVIDRSQGPMPENGSRLLRALIQARPKGIVVVSNRDSATFATEIGRTSNPRLSLEGMQSSSVPVVEVHQRAIGDLLRQAGVDLSALRGSAAWTQKDLPGLTVMIDLEQEVIERVSAPNTIGLLEGTDPKLKAEFLVFSAHMDHIGISSGQADSINNGADDDGSGTVGVVELAEAFSQARPRRSVLFITVSGEEKGLWGSQYFSEHPTVPIANVVADLNIDMIGRNWKDTIVAIGKEHSNLGTTLNRVNQSHPELRMNAIDDRWPQENFYFRSDHYNFARKGVPILFFFNGTHPDYHRPSDSPDKIDAEKESRILKLLFFLGQDIANATARPTWNPESYKQIVEGNGGRAR
ncbi:MAG: M28 family peptidase [Gemmatimonadota bacterium]